MGQEILYCFNCGTRLTTAEFDSGKAHRIGTETTCPACLPTLLEMIPPEERERFLKPSRGTTSIRKRSEGTSVIRRAGGETPVAKSPERKRLYLMMAGGGAALVALGIGVGFLIGGKTPPPQVAAPIPMPVPPAPAAAPPKDPGARALVPVEATESPDVAQLEKEIQAPLQEENFKRALELLDKAKDRQARPSWIREVDRKIDEVRAAADGRFKEIRKQAASGGAEELKSLRARIARWGLEDILAAFDESFAAVPAPVTPPVPAAPPAPEVPKERTAEGKAYLEQWMGAVAPASRRDYAAALDAVKKASEPFKEKSVEREAAGDLKDLKSVEAAYQAALQAVSQFPPGRRSSFDLLGASGVKEAVEAIVVWADARRVEFRRPNQKETFYVQPHEFGAATLADALRESGRTKAADLRAAALFLLLEGEAEAAGKLAVKDLPEKYLEYAKGAVEKVVKSPDAGARAEGEALRLAWAAARDFGRMETIGGAIEKYKRLARDYPAASCVLKEIDLITRRSEMGREYVFLAADLSGSGACRLVSDPKQGHVWACEKDVEIAALAKQTYVEATFYALPDTEYRCWVFAGACCEETFACYLQATDLKGPHPAKRKEEISYEPDADAALPVDHKVKNLKKSHDAHGGDKQPARWEWMQVALPKYPKAGAKQVRIMTDQKGFSVSMAIVSSLRKNAPRSTEMDEERRRAAEEADARLDLEAGLLLRWSFDGAGGAAADESGRGHKGTPAGKPKRSAEVPPAIKAEGAGCLELDGKDDQIVTPGTADLSLDWADLTVAAWVCPTKEAPMRLLGKWTGKMGWFVDVHSDAKGKKARGQVRVKLNDGQADVDHVVLGRLPHDGKEWAHLAFTVDRRARELRVYVDGVQVGNTRVISSLSQGLSNPAALELSGKGLPLAGRVDEVRLYARALSSAEIQSLMRRATGKK